jgi:hypothetical protein
MTVERYLSIRIIKWRLSYFKTKEAIILSISMGFILSIMNASLVSFIDFDTAKTNITCFVDEQFTRIMQVNKYVVTIYSLLKIFCFKFKAHITVYGFSTYFIMTIINIMLIHSIKVKEESTVHSNQTTNEKKKSLTFTVLILTVFFIFFTLMDNILNAFFLPTILPEDYGYNLLFFADSLAFSYHSLHFLILLITNRKFYAQFKLMFNSSNRVASLSDHSHSRHRTPIITVPN